MCSLGVKAVGILGEIVKSGKTVLCGFEICTMTGGQVTCHHNNLSRILMQAGTVRLSYRVCVLVHGATVAAAVVGEVSAARNHR